MLTNISFEKAFCKGEINKTRNEMGINSIGLETEKRESIEVDRKTRKRENFKKE